MAKIVRKVSNKATKGQKREYGFKRLLRNKIFWIVASVLLVGIACAIILPIVLSNDSTEDTTHEHPDYFNIPATYTDAGEEYEINFKKISYAGLIMETSLGVDAFKDDNFNFNTIEYAFIFAIDVTKFYPEDYFKTDEDEEDDNNLKSEADERVYAALIKLQYEIDKYNENHPNTDDDVQLFIIDTSNQSNNANGSLLADTKFGGTENDDESTTLTTMFSLYKATENSFIRAYSGYDREDETSKYKKYDKNKTDSGISIYLSPSNSIGAANEFEKRINNSISYLNHDFEDFEEQ